MALIIVHNTAEMQVSKVILTQKLVFFTLTVSLCFKHFLTDAEVTDNNLFPSTGFTVLKAKSRVLSGSITIQLQESVSALVCQ